MMKLFKCFFLFVIVLTNAYAQNITDLFARSFLESLINNSDKLTEFVSSDELKLSNRLGISYFETKFKFLISNDIAPLLKDKLKENSLKYEYNIETIDNNYSKIIFQVPTLKIKNEYYFNNSKLISQPYYFSKDWTKQRSKYFEFHISDSNLFNNYSRNKLDSFVDEMLKLLEFSETEINKLKKEKIHYFFCKDENEIELLTNYKARGLYYLPYDYIISTFTTHYHEVLHLLMNYKLQTLNLYTLPFLQEGFAVVFGGRGGKEPNVILETGLFLAHSNFIDYKTLLNKADFYQFDASISYPISGLYVKFLIKYLGMSRFLELYKKYSGNQIKINTVEIDSSELPLNTEWLKYLNSQELNNHIRILDFDVMNFQEPIIETKDYCIYDEKDSYLFKLKDAIEIKTQNIHSNYKSKLFNDMFPQRVYQNQKYIITVSSDEVSVYNFLSNNLIAKYVKGFSVSNKSVTKMNDLFVFLINKKVFDEPLENSNIENLRK